MSHYRLYRLDDANHIREAVDVECIDDGDAVTRAGKYVDGTGVEVWQGVRRVARLTPEQKPPRA